MNMRRELAKLETHARPNRTRASTRVQSPASPRVGISEWFRIGEHERVERVLADLRILGIRDIRTAVSWADWHRPEGPEWLDWLLPRLARENILLPCFVYTPPSLAIVPKVSSPPRDPKAFADFIDQMIRRYGRHFDWIELWAEPNNSRYWDVTLDPDWLIFTTMTRNAAHWAQHLGKKTVLGGPSSVDVHWLRMMANRGLLNFFGAVGVHHHAGCSEMPWQGWQASVAAIRTVLDEQDDQTPEIWITETGYSTWTYDERKQLATFAEALQAPVDRLYWQSVHDLDPSLSDPDNHLEDREFHYGLKQSDGTAKLLFRLWASGGLAEVRRSSWLSTPSKSKHSTKPVLITGGCGFVGTNLASHLLQRGRPVLLLDNLSRLGVEHNLRWLTHEYGNLVQIEVADVRDAFALKKAVSHCSQVFHFAAQVAVTTSLAGPLNDFGVNAKGTLNLLEALRSQTNPPPLIFTSTNKVYGALDDLTIRPLATRYEPDDRTLRRKGIGEDRPLDFHSPYGCSKGTADQYILDYARTYSLPTIVFRMSCIYGPHQFGTEDQGWVAFFLIRALQKKPITIFGDGKQVRDLLYVEDLVDAFLAAERQATSLAGQAFNIGGGVSNTASLLELLEMIASICKTTPRIHFSDWRQGDQRYYSSDISRFTTATGWRPKTNVRAGLQRLHKWLITENFCTAEEEARVETYEVCTHQSQLEL